jgi:hypothetical protein
MLQPFRIDMYVYANSPEEAALLSSKLKDFVSEKRNQGIVVSADKLSKAIDAFGNNPLLLHFLK